MNEPEQEDEIEADGLLYSCENEACGHVVFLKNEKGLRVIGDAIKLRRTCPICGGTMILLPTP